MPILAKKNHLFRWSSFWYWRVCKQAKLSYLGHWKPARIDWKTGAPKTRYKCAIFLRKRARRGRHNQWRSLSGYVKSIKRRILAAFGFNRTMLRTTQPKQHSIFWALFLKIALLVAELMSFGHLGAAIWHRWTIICVVPSKISVTPSSQRQLTL